MNHLFEVGPSLATQVIVIVLSVIAANFDYRKRLSAMEKTMTALLARIEPFIEAAIRQDERLKTLESKDRK